MLLPAGGVACGEDGTSQKTGLGYEVDKTNMFGICVLPSDLPEPSRDPGVTTDIVCDLIKEMGVKSVRVWMHIPFVLEREPHVQRTQPEKERGGIVP